MMPSVHYLYANNQHNLTLEGLSENGTPDDGATVNAYIFDRSNVELAGPVAMAPEGGGTGNYAVVLDGNLLDAYISEKPLPVTVRIDVNDGEAEFVLQCVFQLRAI